ncbi:recombinase zinc beta ribbon domain-containing protein, partial [Primorskyibacter sedentarius]|uniref:recombinase zinc beta ribbon domain-containing protein n=1 Tax=Primorskyibacter sedentarius TaxID=745311 RepID=UPI003EBB325E
MNGNPARGTGILNNELYIGRRVWNRLRYSKDPLTGRRVSRLNPPEKLTVTDIPELRIIDQELWNAVKDRQAMMSNERGSNAEDRSTLTTTRNNKRRKYLLSGLIRCGLCDGPMTIAGGNPKAGKRRYYCANAREKGRAICAGMPG